MTQLRWRFTRILSLIIGITMVLAACSTTADTNNSTANPESQSPEANQSASNDPPIRIGFSSALTGPYNEYGESQKKAAELAVEKWNSNGGVAGRNVELITYDDQLNASKATVNVQKLLNEDKVDGFIFPAGSTPTLAVHQMVVQSGIPAINEVATSPEVVYNKETGEAYPNIFNFAAQNDIEAEALGAYVAESWKKVGLITESTEYGKQAGENIKEYLEHNTDSTLVAWEEYDQKAPDVTAQLGKLKAAGAEVVTMVALGADAATVRKGIERMGWDVQLVGSKGIFGNPYLEIAGDLVEGSQGMTITTWVDPERYTEEQKDFAERWKAKYGNDRYYGDGEWPIANFSLQAYMYDGIDILLEAMNRAGTTEPQKVIDELNKLSGYPGALGIEYSFTPEVHHAITVEVFGIAGYKKVGDKIQIVRID